jgi:DNA-binding NarL/FixJ family response regulator
MVACAPVIAVLVSVERIIRLAPGPARAGPVQQTVSDQVSGVGPAIPQANGNGQLVDDLTEREREVLAVLSTGRTNSEIAGDLFVASGTVKSHVNAICRKLGARNRTEAVARARKLGLVTDA